MCGFTFNSKADLDKHIQAQHVDLMSGTQGSFKCDTWGLAFASKDGMNIHLKTHDPFNCVKCGSTFDSKANLDKHIRAQHVDVMSPKSSRVFQERSLDPFPPFQDVLEKIIQKIENMDKKMQSLVKV